jgi:CO dehydrogenase maturation factor
MCDDCSHHAHEGNGKRLISVCGKGGAGKTVFTAMMTRALIESGRAGKMLVIDADPALGQLSALGTSVRRTMGQVREDIIRTARAGNKEAKAELNEKLDYLVFEALTETDDFALLAMGRTETLGCYCPVNTLLRHAIEKLSVSFDTIVIDGEAGIEQINRQVTRHLDDLLIISDASTRGLETAAAIRRMVLDERILDCERMGLVLNRVMGSPDLLERSAARIGLPIVGLVPYDPRIAEHDLMGTPITQLADDAAGLSAVRSIVENYVLA